MAFTPTILFILGPSGVGKSTFANYLVQTHGWLHLDLDQPNSIEINQLQHEWESFYSQRKALHLIQNLRQRVTSANKTNFIITLPSTEVLSPEHIKACLPLIQICYFYGSADHCINAFLRRELETDRGLDINYWIRNNRVSYINMSLPCLEPYRVHVFTHEGHHLSNADILVEVSKANIHSE